MNEKQTALAITFIHDQSKAMIREQILSMLDSLSSKGITTMTNELRAIKQDFEDINSENVSTVKVVAYLGALEIDLILAEWLQRNTDGPTP